MENTLTGVVAYFRALTESNTDLRSFVHGTARRIVEQSRTQTEYPALWLETPVLALTDKDGTAPSGRRQFALVVLDTYERGDDAAEDAAMERTEALMLEILSKLRRDRKELGITFSFNDSILEPVSPISAAGETGYRVELTFDKPVPFCYHPDKWA